MFQSLNHRTIALAPVSIATDATAALVVDTRGFAEAKITVLPGTTNNVTNNFSVLKIEQGDTTSAFSDLSGYVGGTNAAGGFTIPTNLSTAATAAQPYVFSVDLRGKRRFLRISATPKTAVVVGMTCDLSRPVNSPDSLAELVAGSGSGGTAAAASTTLSLAVGPDGAIA